MSPSEPFGGSNASEPPAGPIAASLSSIARWPNVPACYGWVTLDPRGRWRLGPQGGELVHHPGLIAFLNEHYGSTVDGAWFVQNGPQRAFVTLERAPYVVRLQANGALITHTGLAVRDVRQALLDADGNAYLACEHGLVGIDDRDLGALVSSDEANPERTGIRVDGRVFELVETDKTQLPERFGFISCPHG